MPWGTFKDCTKEDGLTWTHIVPCTEDGTMLKPHKLTLGCPCQPAILDTEPLIIHENIT